MKVIIKKRVKSVGEHIGGKIFLDSRIPEKFRKSIAYHEKVEDGLMRKKRLRYSKAHRIANKKEKEKFFKNNKKAWKEEERIVWDIYSDNLYHWKKKKNRKNKINKKSKRVKKISKKRKG